MRPRPLELWWSSLWSEEKQHLYTPNLVPEMPAILVWLPPSLWRGQVSFAIPRCLCRTFSPCGPGHLKWSWAPDARNAVCNKILVTTSSPNSLLWAFLFCPRQSPLLSIPPYSLLRLPLLRRYPEVPGSPREFKRGPWRAPENRTYNCSANDASRTRRRGSRSSECRGPPRARTGPGTRTHGPFRNT